MAPQYIQGSRGNPASGGDIIQLSFRRRHNSEMSGDVVERSLSQLRQWGTNFTQKYAMFLDRIFTIQTQFNTEIFERCSATFYCDNSELGTLGGVPYSEVSSFTNVLIWGKNKCSILILSIL